jgi:hypothetical protein
MPFLFNCSQIQDLDLILATTPDEVIMKLDSTTTWIDIIGLQLVLFDLEISSNVLFYC